MIEQLPSNSSGDDEGITSSDIEDCKYGIAKPLTMILNRSLKEHEPLECPYISKIFPVAKPNKKKSDAASYRPISLTSQIVKIIKRVLPKALRNT